MSSAKRSNEPLIWFLFGGGGFLAAFFLPIHILLTGILFPLKVIKDPGFYKTAHMLHHPLTRLYLFVLIFFCLFHAAHRIRGTLIDALQLRHLGTALAVICYGGALLGSLITVILLIQVP